jgi:hypothetical protein
MTAGLAKRWLNSNNHSMRTLVALCRGILNDNGSQILDIMMDPWRFLPLYTIKPKSEEYKVEIKCRWEQFNSEGAKEKKPKPTQWNIDKCLKWLDDHPIINETDIAFLQQTVSLRIKFANDAATQERIEKEITDRAEKNWYGPVPYLCILHALIEFDEIKKAYLEQNNIASSRLGVENCKSDQQREVTVWQRLANNFVDPNFVAITVPQSHLHSDFNDSQTITYDMVSSLAADPDKIMNTFATVMVDLKRVIDRWEISGQGDGGLDVELNGDEEGYQRPEFGRLEG